MVKEQISSLTIDVTDTAAAFETALTVFDDDSIDIVPFEGSWTAGQAAEHAVMSLQGVAKTLVGNTAGTLRDPAQYVIPLKTQFLDFTIKMKSPEFILPFPPPHQKLKLLAEAAAAFQILESVTRQTDLDATCLDFEFPDSGPLTRLEWINFVLSHTKRHIYQLNNIAEKLKIQK
jgi:hypothetical protein